MTKLEALNLFCTYFDFTNSALPGETKVQFLARKQKSWAIEIVQRQLEVNAEEVKQSTVATESAGLDL